MSDVEAPEPRGADAAYLAELLEHVMLGELTLGDIQKIKPEQIEAIYTVAQRRYVQGQNAEAEKLFSYLCRIDHLAARHWLGLGATRQRLGRHEQAVKAYAACAMLDPENPVPALFAAESFLALGDLENAESGLFAARFWAGDKPEHRALRDRAEVLTRALERKRGGAAAAGEATAG